MSLSLSLPSIEEQVKWLMKPLEELCRCSMFENLSSRDSTCWFVTVGWSEPNTEELNGWKRHKKFGQLNKRFLTWAQEHYEFWISNAHVPLNVLKIEYLTADIVREVGW
ncbi:MAG: hypothetical protein WAP52_03680 [Candidatus Sungiibacteriota bacterium]